jgi:NitT/TauT family transport system ATP-binding protein
MMEDRIVIRGVTKAFDGKLALDTVDLVCPAGSFTCLLGPSGCGKSTLLNMIAGFLTPSTGTILVDGRIVTEAGADRGMVFQEYALFPWRTVIENVRFGPMIRRLPTSEQLARAHRYLAMVGLSNHADAYPYQLSGGMKQRVAIARALVNDPSVLLMDEPFGALDAQTRETLQEELLAIWQQDRKTVVFVTHSINEALFLADRIVIMATRPGSIREVVEVTIPHPRDRSGDAFVGLERRLHGLMREEVKKLGVS